ncbi:hypothetical protein F4818DRAFT_445685 [Hypoxylon cercidicola]|nr:hypothetical protein F4818DRAFT_445685 [Hypoxylon cercidicola]
MAHLIQGLLGPFARILESRVSLAHQSAKDFFLGDRIYDSLSPTLRTINKENAELQMAVSCIRYLMLEDFSKDFSSTENSPVDSMHEPSNTDGSSSGIGKMFLESEKSKHKLYIYASSHWTGHLALCEISAPVWRKESAKALLDAKIGNSRNWVHFYLANVVTAIDQDLAGLDQLTLAAFFNLHESLVNLPGQGAAQRVKDQALFWVSIKSGFPWA